MVSDQLPHVFTPEELKQNETHKNELINLIDSHNAILVVGSGSSKFVGYPSWDELLEELRSKFAPTLEKHDGRYDHASFANQIKEQVKASNREGEYYPKTDLEIDKKSKPPSG